MCVELKYFPLYLQCGAPDSVKRAESLNDNNTFIEVTLTLVLHVAMATFLNRHWLTWYTPT